MPTFRAAALALLAAAQLATAASIKHQHKHQHAHEKRVDYNDPNLYKDVNWAEVFADHPVGGAAPATPAPAAAAPAAPAAAKPEAKVQESSSSSSASTGASGGSGFGGISSAIASGNVDTYIGNVGVPYGSNIIKVASADGYDYTITMKNANSLPIKVIVWNKSGPDGQANSGQFSTPALTVPLAAGASQIVAFDKNTQGAFCQSNGKKTSYGAWDCTYGEFDFDNESNGGWSGYDVSSIQNSDGNNSPLSISSANGETSSNNGNNYVSDAQPGGIGGNLAPGAAHLTATFG